MREGKVERGERDREGARGRKKGRDQTVKTCLSLQRNSRKRRVSVTLLKFSITYKHSIQEVVTTLSLHNLVEIKKSS